MLTRRRTPSSPESWLFQPDLEPRRERPRPPKRRRRRSGRLLRLAVGLSAALLLLSGLSVPAKEPRPVRSRGAALVRTPTRKSAATTYRTAGWRGTLAKAVSKPHKKAVRKVRKARNQWIGAWATAYCPTCKVCDTGWITASGRHASRKGAAVAARGRRLAPLGSRVYVPRFGWLRIDDTGGKVRSNQIDIRLQSHRQAVKWGRRWVKVRIEAKA